MQLHGGHEICTSPMSAALWVARLWQQRRVLWACASQDVMGLCNVKEPMAPTTCAQDREPVGNVVTFCRVRWLAWTPSKGEEKRLLRYAHTKGGWNVT